MAEINDTRLTEEQVAQLRSITQQFSDLLSSTNFDQQGQILRAVSNQLAHGFNLRDMHGDLQLKTFALCDYELAMRARVPLPNTD